MGRGFEGLVGAGDAEDLQNGAPEFAEFGFLLESKVTRSAGKSLAWHGNNGVYQEGDRVVCWGLFGWRRRGIEEVECDYRTSDESNRNSSTRVIEYATFN